MVHFTSVKTSVPWTRAISEAFEIKRNKFADCSTGKHRTALLIFFNSSLRTRLSTQKAAENLGMNVIVLDVQQGTWNLETRKGVIMDGDKPEHLLEAIPVMGCYADIIGVRSFARFERKEDDYNELILDQFIKYSGRPIISMESATRHPLQSFADHITIEEYKTKEKPKVVLTRAPHPKALRKQSHNSFAEWMIAAGYKVTITHPKGYELDERFTRGAEIVYDQQEAFRGADFIYAKNWAAFQDPLYGKVLNKDLSGWWTTGKWNLPTTDILCTAYR